MDHRIPSALLMFLGCGGDPEAEAWLGRPAINPDGAELALIDRFSPDAGVLAVRSDANGLPGPGEPIEFDRWPFLVQGFGPGGERIRYYDLDVKSQIPAKMYVFSRRGASLDEQLPVVSALPGSPNYNDFWQLYDVQVPDGYQANSIVREEDILDSGFLVSATSRLVHRAVVPAGSSAVLRYAGGDSGLGRAWYAGMIAPYFSFEQSVPSQSGPLGGLAVDISYIWVAFNVNADLAGGGPASGTKLDESGVQTHNVAETLPGDAGYSPLWMVIMYDNADFAGVLNRDSAERASVVAGVGSPLVNCPVVAKDL